MKQKLPIISLSNGQAAWVLNQGQEPSKRLLDQLGYLRQLGIPFSEKEKGGGRGNRVRFGFDHLAECAVALEAIRRGIKPGDIASQIIKERERYRKTFRDAFQIQPVGALSSDWVKSRGVVEAFMGDDYYLRIKDRYQKDAGKLEIECKGPGTSHDDPMELIQRYSDGSYAPVIALSSIVLPIVAWAMEAPDIRPGRPS